MLVLDMLFVVSAVLFDMLKARQLACVSKNGQKCPAALSLSSWRAWIEMRIGTPQIPALPGRSPHGERGLKYGLARIVLMLTRRSPHGERGLKCDGRALGEHVVCRSPHGERGLKWNRLRRFEPSEVGRSPHGERGLKSYSRWVFQCYG